MKLIVLLATIFLLSVRSIKIDQLEYGFCGELDHNNKLLMLSRACQIFSKLILKYFHTEGADSSVGTIDVMDVQPFPVEVKTGATVTVSATLTLNTEVPAGAKVALNIVKEGLVDLPIPCLEIEGLHIGSW